ncbi:hypothetical protein PCANC_21606 [Puccinia coronata f. sp. avenae]|uniref:Uncharacterized protein n=1 Tax=Puccinia coronata f. sp. avenae TaxID=200324 RepID=A0A2N5SD24_9BASI|nr:hypothetical protein PCANC_21606 [Puccinia coronata f. sp. avenae]
MTKPIIPLAVLLLSWVVNSHQTFDLLSSTAPGADMENGSPPSRFQGVGGIAKARHMSLKKMLRKKLGQTTDASSSMTGDAKPPCGNSAEVGVGGATGKGNGGASDSSAGIASAIVPPPITSGAKPPTVAVVSTPPPAPPVSSTGGDTGSSGCNICKEKTAPPPPPPAPPALSPAKPPAPSPSDTPSPPPVSSGDTKEDKMKPKDSGSKTDSSNEKSSPPPVSSGEPTPASSGVNVTSTSSGDGGISGKPKPKSSDDKEAMPPVSSGGSPPPGGSDDKMKSEDETSKSGSGEKGAMAPAGTPAKRSLAKAAPSKEDAQEDIDDEDDDDDTLKKASSSNTTLAKGPLGSASKESNKTQKSSAAAYLSVNDALEFHLGVVGLMAFGTLLIL